MTSPNLDALAAVAKRAVQNLKQRDIGVKIQEPPTKSKKAAEPPVKRHQHPLPSKGRSAYVGKGKAAAPAKKPPEIVKVSLQDLLGTLFPAPEPKVTSSPRPTATIVPKPVSTTAEATTTETIQIDDEPTKKDKAPELPPTTRVEEDLELSQDSEEELHGVCIIDVGDEPPVFSFSDVEPDDTPEELAARQQQEATSTIATSSAIPELLMGFQETVVISDDASESVPTAAPSKRRAIVTTSASIVTSTQPTTTTTPTTSTTVLEMPGFILVTEPYRPTSPPIVISATSSPLDTSTILITATSTTPTTTVTTDAPATSSIAAPGSSTEQVSATSSTSTSGHGQRPSSSLSIIDIPERKPC